MTKTARAARWVKAPMVPEAPGTGQTHGDLPPEPWVLPLNLLRAVVPAAGAAAAAVAVRAGLKPRRPKGDQP